MKNVLAIFCCLFATHIAKAIPLPFLESHCYECHDEETTKGNLNLTALPFDITSQSQLETWIKIFDRVHTGEMPPKKQPRPNQDDANAFLKQLSTSITQAENQILTSEKTTKTPLRRLTRNEYENTIRDLFDLPGLTVSERLPADGSSHGFDNNSEALSISHVNLAKYMEAADHILDHAICTQPKAPEIKTQQVSLASQYYVRLLLANNGGAVYLKDFKPDPEFPPTSKFQHVDRGAHERLGMYETKSSVGLFRHEDASLRPWFQGFAAVYPGLYKFKIGIWSYKWDKGEIKENRGTEAARLSIMRLEGRGRGQDHPSFVFGYYAAPSLKPMTHEFAKWLHNGESIGFNVSSLAPVHIYHQYKRNVMSFTGPGIACDGIEISGPFYKSWPPPSHKLLFGELPLVEFDSSFDDIRYPTRIRPRQDKISAKNKPDEWQGNWTVDSPKPLEDAQKLLKTFLPKAFRAPVEPTTVHAYVNIVKGRLEAGDCFELAMRRAYKTALCAPEFLYHLEPVEKSSTKLTQHALANRLSYFLWNSMPDQQLTDLAKQGKLNDAKVLKAEIERLLKSPKAQRFIKDFPGQWLRLREIAATDPDRKLYPEFSSYLQDCMVMETEAFFQEMLEKDLDASHLIASDFAMINEKLATHYGIEGVSGPEIRRVPLPENHPRGGFLTQASILKITANGTTTSPIPRGTFVMERLLGIPPPPPPSSVPSIEPDVRGTTTIRDQLNKHRADPNCAGCHAKIDPAGFALEAFDVIGGLRSRYRTVEIGDNAERGSIDPFIHISFKLGQEVQTDHILPDGRQFQDIIELQKLLTENTSPLVANLAQHLAIYSTGRTLNFSDRQSIQQIVANTEKQKGGLRTILHELVQSDLFQAP